MQIVTASAIDASARHRSEHLLQQIAAAFKRVRANRLFLFGHLQKQPVEGFLGHVAVNIQRIANQSTGGGRLFFQPPVGARPPRRPGVFPPDQGSQFPSQSFTGVLLEEGIPIRMDGRGRALDNIFVERLWRSVKYEDVYLKGYVSMSDLLLGLTEYFAFYNGERPHQALGNRTPDAVYRLSLIHI